MISKTDRVLPKETPSTGVEDEEEVEDEPDVVIMEEQSVFEDVMVWGHEIVPEEDPFTRGVEEWIIFAEQVSFRERSLGLCFADHGRSIHTKQKGRVYRGGIPHSGV